MTLDDIAGTTRFKRSAADALGVATASFRLRSLALGLGGNWLACVLACGATCEDIYYKVASTHFCRAHVTAFCLALRALATTRTSRFQSFPCRAEVLARG